MTGIILAGGQSRRMGRDKAFLPWGTTTFLGGIAEALRGVFDELLLVGNRLEEPLPGSRLVRDAYSSLGPLAGIQAGLAAASCEQAFVCACDMPYVSASGIAPLLLAARGTRDWQAIVPVGERGPEPLLACYAKSGLPVIEDVLGSGSPRILNILPRLRTFQLPAALFPDQEVFRNINTPEEYQSALLRQCEKV